MNGSIQNNEVEREHAERGSRREHGLSFARTLRVWVVDDQEPMRHTLAALFNGENGFRCTASFPSVELLLEALAQGTYPDIVLADLHLGNNRCGIEAIRPVKTVAPSTRVVIMTTFTNAVAQSQAFHAGADGFALKSHGFDRLKAVLRRACDNPSTTVLAAPMEAARNAKPERAVLLDKPVSVRPSCRRHPFGFLRQFLNVFAL